jgi:hypothetical protein
MSIPINTNPDTDREERKARTIVIGCGLFVGAVIGGTAVGLIRPSTRELLQLTKEQAQSLIEHPDHLVRFETTGFRIVDVIVAPE